MQIGRQRQGNNIDNADGSGAALGGKERPASPEQELRPKTAPYRRRATALAAGPVRHGIGGYRVEFSDPRGFLQFGREAVGKRQGKETPAQQQGLTGTESSTLGLRMAMQMHDVGIGRRNEGIEIGKPF